MGTFCHIFVSPTPVHGEGRPAQQEGSLVRGKLSDHSSQQDNVSQHRWRTMANWDDVIILP